jgi:hypothetical protein
MRTMIEFRWWLAAMVALLCALFYSPAAFAQTCVFGAANCINIHIDGIAGEDGNGNYNVLSYDWGEPGVPAPPGASSQLSFSRALTDTTTVDLMRYTANHRKAAAADLAVIFAQTPTVIYHLVGVQFLSVRHKGTNTSSNPETEPSETVTLHFTELDYTYQPILPNGQKNGPPVMYTWKFN